MNKQRRNVLKTGTGAAVLGALAAAGLIDDLMDGTLLAAQAGKDAQARRISQQAEVVRNLLEYLACLVHVVFLI